MKFKKTCFSCGAKASELRDGMCSKCFSSQVDAVKEIKPVNLKICNMCKKIHYGSRLYTFDEIKEMLPELMRKRVIINEGYKLNSVDVSDIELEGHKVSFTCSVDADLK